MLTHPLTKQSIYYITVLYSGILTLFTVLVTQNFFLLVLVFLVPCIYSGLQLRQSDLSSITPQEKRLAKHTPMVFWKYLTGGVIVLSLVTITTDALLVFVVGLGLLCVSSIPMRVLHHWFYHPYTQIEFGFREVLPSSKHWIGMFVALWNANNARHTYIQQIWYWIAAKRSETLLSSLPNTRYANHTTAEQYNSILHDHSQTGKRSESQAVFSELLELLSELYCQSCGSSKPVEDLYLLTEDGVVSEAYCIDCLHTNSQKTSGSNSNQSQSSNGTTENQDLQHALNIFNFTDITTVSSDDLTERYRSLVKEVHPDTGGSEDAFTEVQEAYEVLQEYTVD